MELVAKIIKFLVYKIADCRYNRRVAYIVAILFAMMPSWLLRRAPLDNFLMPYLLSSILFPLFMTNVDWY
jgi:hypothetical protein